MEIKYSTYYSNLKCKYQTNMSQLENIIASTYINKITKQRQSNLEEGCSINLYLMRMHVLNTTALIGCSVIRGSYGWVFIIVCKML